MGIEAAPNVTTWRPNLPVNLERSARNPKASPDARIRLQHTPFARSRSGEEEERERDRGSRAETKELTERGRVS